MNFSGALFVACPAVDDPIQDFVSDPHITLAFFGDAEEVERRDPGVVADLLEVGDFLADNTPGFSVSINGTGVLGDDAARVWLVESVGLVQLYQSLVELDPVDVLLAANPDKHPWWIPHMTYSYDSEAAPVERPESIQITRLGLWWGDERETWDLAGPGLEMVNAAGLLPQIDTVTDLPLGIRVAQRNPNARWYVERRAKALGQSHLLPSGWAS